MADNEIDAAIAEVCGVGPELVEWWAYKDTPDGGSICYSAQSKEEVEKWLASLPEGSLAKDYVPKAFYRYPNYSGDLNLMHAAEKIIPAGLGVAWARYRGFLVRLRGESSYHRASARQRAEAFLRALGEWKEEEMVFIDEADADEAREAIQRRRIKLISSEQLAPARMEILTWNKETQRYDKQLFTEPKESREAAK